jgi:hypothetical protein
MNQHSWREADTLETVLAADHNARLATEAVINQLSKRSVETNAA